MIRATCAPLPETTSSFDATVIRVLLIPALMPLLGDANLWMPIWTRTALRIGEHERQPQPTRENA